MMVIVVMCKCGVTRKSKFCESYREHPETSFRCESKSWLSGSLRSLEDKRLRTERNQAFLTPTLTAAYSVVTLLTVMLKSTVQLATSNLMLMHLYVLCFRVITIYTTPVTWLQTK